MDAPLAHRDWYCFGTVGSSGDSLLVALQPIDQTNATSGLNGPAVQLIRRFGDTSGRSSVAEMSLPGVYCIGQARRPDVSR